MDALPDSAGHGVEVVPLVVISQTFAARPSSIPDIRQFVRHCLAQSPLSDQDSEEIGHTVSQALLDAAGPTGAIQVAFRIFPEHVEVDVLRSDTRLMMPAGLASLIDAMADRPPGAPPAERVPPPDRTFAAWMSAALRREGWTHDAAARQLGVSVKTVSRWVGGETEPRLRDLQRIKEVFGELPSPLAT